MRRIASGLVLTSLLASWVACAGDAFTTAPGTHDTDGSVEDSSTPPPDDASMPPPPGMEASVEEGGVVSPPPEASSPPPVEASVMPMGCPAGRGPAMVLVDKFCIDKTEVTSAQYNDFLLAGAPAPTQPAACSFNTTYLPGNGWVYAPSDASLPIASVNWCQAYAFCKWAGKRLCGKVGGGSAEFGNFTSNDNEHYLACSNVGTRLYPYGNTFKPGACNGLDVDAGQALPVASLAACQGGVDGLFDMAGNVEEWQDACDGNSGANDQCLNGNGAFDYGDQPTGTRCDFADSDFRSGQFTDVGFRCCATPP